MIKCNRCGAIFDSDEVVVIHDDPSPAGVSLTSGYYEYWECPQCGSGDIDDACECPVCGEWHTGETGSLCEDCAEDLESALNELRDGMHLSKNDFEQAVAEYFGLGW